MNIDQLHKAYFNESEVGQSTLMLHSVIGNLYLGKKKCVVFAHNRTSALMLRDMFINIIRYSVEINNIEAGDFSVEIKNIGSVDFKTIQEKDSYLEGRRHVVVFEDHHAGCWGMSVHLKKL